MPTNLPVGPLWGLGMGGAPPVGLPSMGNEPSVASLQLDIPLPEVFPIPDAKEFNPLGFIAGAGVVSNITITNTTFTVPDSTYGVIRGLSLYVNDMTPTTAITYTLVINQGSPQGFTNLSMFPRTATSVGNSFDPFIRFEGPATIFIRYSQTDAGLNLIGASYSGWWWPKASDQRWRKYGR